MAWAKYLGVLFSLISPYIATAAPTGAHDNAQGLRVETSSGELQGFINETAPSVRQFLGVPYAEPPVGKLRFEAPVSPKRGQTVINATAWAPSCYQSLSSKPTVFTEEVPQFLINGRQSEDCLYLNIWAPRVENIPEKEKLPVFVYIPGGGFTSGGADSMYKIPDKWIQRTQSHIVVVLNYCVNVFGYPNAPGLKSPNVGLLDQRAAVEWTYKNIAVFGGDPSRITLWGQSAGAASVSAYGYAWPKDPIVAGLISDSGVASLLYSEDFEHSNFTALANLVGYDSTKHKDIVEYMRQVPAETLQNAMYQTTLNASLSQYNFIPLADNVTFFNNLTDRANKGLLAEIPSIIGNNNNEGVAFVTWEGTSAPNQTAADIETFGSFTCPAWSEVKNRALHNRTSYQYFYTGNFSNISPLPWMGAYHSSELPLLFGTHYEFRGNSTPFQWQLSYIFEDLWLSFARNSRKAPSVTYTTSDGKQETWTWPAATADQSSSKIVQWPYGQEYMKAVDSITITSGCPAS